MNRKISILVAGLALAATMTGCTKTAAPYVTPYRGIHRGTAAGDQSRQYNQMTTQPTYRYDGIAGNYRLPRSTGGYVGSDGRWQNYNRVAPTGISTPDGYPDASTMYR